MKRLTRAIGLALFMAGSVVAGPALAADKKPNILVILGDDIGIENISYNNRGMMGYQTPNIDRIASAQMCPGRGAICTANFLLVPHVSGYAGASCEGRGGEGLPVPGSQASEAVSLVLLCFRG